MSKVQVTNAALLASALALTTENIVKGRSSGNRKTYVDRFISCLLDENGNPTEPKTRRQVIAEISLEIAIEENKFAKETNPETPDFDLSRDAEGHFKSQESVDAFKVINIKVKNQVAAAIANSQNATSVSYNEKYKDVWTVVKGDRGTVSLQAK